MQLLEIFWAELSGGANAKLPSELRFELVEVGQRYAAKANDDGC